MTWEEASASRRRRPQETRPNKTELTSLFLKHKILDLQVAVTPTTDRTKRNDKRAEENEETETRFPATHFIPSLSAFPPEKTAISRTLT